MGPNGSDISTYLFKTSRGECGILQVVGVVKDERGYHGAGYQGHGMKFRYKLVQQPGPNGVLQPYDWRGVLETAPVSLEVKA